MKGKKRFISVIVVALSVFLLLGSCALPSGTGKSPTGTIDPNKPPLVFSATQSYGTLNPDALGDTQLLEYAQKRLSEYVGREVKIEWMIDTNERAGGATFSALSDIQMWDASGDAPWMFNSNHLHWSDIEAMEYVKNTNFFKEFTVDSINAQVPNYAKRVADLGYAVQALFDDTKDKDNGKLYGLPYAIGPSSFPKIIKDGFPVSNWNYYTLYVRDDILKQIYPNARSAQELKDLYVQNNGVLTVEDFTKDINFGTLDQLHDYMVKVRDLGLKVGDKPVIPGALCGSSVGTGSIAWSMQTIMGFAWKWTINLAETVEDCKVVVGTETFREYLRWWNKAYTENLLDPEIFIMKDDQYRAKAVNGEYALVNTFMGDFIVPATQVGNERGYGWRPVPLGYGGAMEWDFNNSFQGTGNAALAAQSHFWKGIPDADYPDVLKVFEFFTSEENDSIMAWGHPDWYTGNGKDRRYKDGYNDLVRWTVYGASGGKDGKYYGITAGIDSLYGEGANRRREIAPFGLFDCPPDAPRYIYPKDDPELLAQIDLFTVMNETFRDDTTLHANTYSNNGWSENDWAGGAMWDAYNRNLDPNSDDYAVAAIHGKPEEFDGHYAKYLKAMEDAGLRAAEKDSAERFVAVFNEIISKQKIN